MQLSKPWEEIIELRQRALIEAELRREVAAHSAAFYRDASVLAHRIDQDDFLFKTSSAQWPYAIVHLTFSGKAEAEPWPRTRLFGNVEAVMTVMVQDTAEYKQ